MRRNRERFPSDFVFQLTRDEVAELNRSQFVTGSQKHRDPRFRPYAFSEQGVATYRLLRLSQPVWPRSNFCFDSSSNGSDGKAQRMHGGEADRLWLHYLSSHCQGRFPTDLGETLSAVTGVSRIARVETVNILDQQATSAQPLSEKESGKIGAAATEHCCAASRISPDKTGQHDHATLQF